MQEEGGALDFGKLRPQPVDDLRCVELSFVPRLQRQEVAAGVGRLRAAGAAGLRTERLDIRILENDVAQLLHRIDIGDIAPLSP